MLDRDERVITEYFPPRGDGLSAPKRLVRSSTEFVADFVPPDYLIDGLLQRRFCYSFTGATGAGKTAVSLLMTSRVALGRAVGSRGVEPGRVLFLAGENPDDIRMRWIAMSETEGFDIDTIEVHFIPGVFKIPELEDRIRCEAEQLGGLAFVVVDTSATYFEGNDENSNVQMGAHARQLRSLTTLPGGPCVMINCHPIKNASSDNLLPRGGGAFVAEMDGNLTCTKNDTLATLHWQGKFRGPDFAPIIFETKTVTVDSKGRLIPTVVAQTISEAEQQAKASDARADEDAMLVALLDLDEGSQNPTSLARHLGWLIVEGKNAGEPNKTRGKRVADRLRKSKLVTDDRGALVLTPKGETAAKKAKYNRAVAGATYG